MNEPKFHPLAAYFPMLPKDEYEELKKSIKNFGLLEPITTLDGMILDGRNRYTACMEIGVTPRYRDYWENGHEPIDFVVAANMRRRHLSPAQKVQIHIDIYGIPTFRGIETPKSSETPAGVSAENKPRSFKDVARETGASETTVSRVVDVQDDESLKTQLREGSIEARAAERAVSQKVANDQLKKFKEREEGKVPVTWQGLYAVAPKVELIANILGQVTNGVDRWLTNEYGLDRIDPQGHTPLLITKTEQAIQALTKFKQALEELKNEHK
jgi:hypothetical protein